MRIKTVVGIFFFFTGIISTAIGVYNFNEFVFVKGWSTWDKILASFPLYATYVAVPIMIGMLLTVDGRIIYKLKRSWILQLHIVSNLIWLYATKVLYDLMTEPAMDVQRYKQVFYLALATLFLFVVGTVIDSIPMRKKEARPRSYDAGMLGAS